jgi:hypothetical protein
MTQQVVATVIPLRLSVRMTTRRRSSHIRPPAPAKYANWRMLLLSSGPML